MKINLQNYEEYFVRYIDGDLSEDEVADVTLFLNQHPELKADLDAYHAAIIHPDTAIIFPDRNSLKQSVHELNFEDYFCRYAEHDLSDDEMKSVEQFLHENPIYQKHLNAYLGTKLVADPAVIYPDKDSLKKRGNNKVIPISIRYIMTAVVAASLLLIVMLKGVEWPTENVNAPVATINKNSQPENTVQEHIEAIKETGHIALPSDSNVSFESQPETKLRLLNEYSPDLQEAGLLADADLEPIKMKSPDLLPGFKRASKAPYLVPVYESNATNIADASNGISSQVGSLLSIASVVGSEILKLSGRGDLVKSQNEDQQLKTREPFSISIQSKKFSFYHKFKNKEKQAEVK